MADLKVTLWQLPLVERLIESGHQEPDLWDWAEELSAEQDAIQSEFRSVGAVFGQLLQVEAGVRRLAAQYVANPEKLRFADLIYQLRPNLPSEFEDELLALDRVRYLRNHFAHGEVRVGVVRMHPESPLEPVIAFVRSSVDLPNSVDQVDEIREVIEGDLQLDEAMSIAYAGLEALMAIMTKTGFDPYSRVPKN